MSYESDCADYAVNGDPQRDHYDYEANAVYDRYDGWAEPADYADDAVFNGYDGRCDCGDPDCSDCYPNDDAGAGRDECQHSFDCSYRTGGGCDCAGWTDESECGNHNEELPDDSPEDFDAWLAANPSDDNSI